MVTDLKRGTDPWFVLTGDTLFVGAVGRPDLPGQRTRERRATLREHPRQAARRCQTTSRSIPGHFSGSLCGAGLSGKPSSTIAFERRWNPMLSLAREAFVAALVDVPAKPAEMERILRGESRDGIAGNDGVSERRPERRRRAGSSRAAREHRAVRLLVVVNAFVGAMVGMERSILPAIADEDFHLAARTAILSFIVVFGVAKAVTNYLAGRAR